MSPQRTESCLPWYYRIDEVRDVAVLADFSSEVVTSGCTESKHGRIDGQPLSPIVDMCRWNDHGALTTVDNVSRK